jgi:hypothetical protein
MTDFEQAASLRLTLWSAKSRRYWGPEPDVCIQTEFDLGGDLALELERRRGRHRLLKEATAEGSLGERSVERRRSVELQAVFPSLCPGRSFHLE